MDKMTFVSPAAPFIFPDESQCRCGLCAKTICKCGEEWQQTGKMQNKRPEIRLLEPKVGRACDTCGSLNPCGYFHLDHPSVAFRANEDSINLSSINPAAKCRCIDTLPDSAEMSMEWPAMPLAHDQDGNMVHKTLRNFRSREGAGAAVKAVEAFCRGEGPRILVLLGVNGSGKSHLLEAIMWAYRGRNIPVRYDKARTLIDRFRATNKPDATESGYELTKAYAKFPVQIIDELKMHEATPFSSEVITDMFDARITSDYRLAIGSNLMIKEEVTKYYGETLADRMWTVNTMQVNLIQMTCGSYRQGGG